MRFIPLGNNFLKRLKVRSLWLGVVLLPIILYRFLLSPILPPSCRFYPTCSEYASDAFKHHGMVMGAWLTIKRLSRCHPWGSSGIDPVPKHCVMIKRSDKNVTYENKE